MTARSASDVMTAAVRPVIDQLESRRLLSVALVNGQLQIKGTTGDDTIRGKNRADKIMAIGGQDAVTARGGNDKVWAGNGHDTVHDFEPHQDRIDLTSFADQSIRASPISTSR